MRVLFVGSHRGDKQFSIVGFEKALERELSGRCEFEAICPGRERTIGGTSKWARYVDKYILFPRELRRKSRSADIVHFGEKGMAMNLPHVKNRPTLSTIHDLLALKAARHEIMGWNVGITGRRYQSMILNAEMMADGVACVSEATRKEVKYYMPGFRGEVRTILNGMYKSFSRKDEAEAIARLEGQFRPKFPEFFVHIGGNKRYKNRQGVLELYAELIRQRPCLKIGLVMAGGPRTVELGQVEEKLGLTGRVQWVVEPTDPQVEAYYSLATALLFPSFAEGFGLPVIEAQACGCPVFVTNRAPMTEVGGDAVVYIDPTEIEESATQVLSNMDNLQELAELGTENVKRFEPRIMADAYLDYYKHIVDRTKLA